MIEYKSLLPEYQRYIVISFSSQEEWDICCKIIGILYKNEGDGKNLNKIDNNSQPGLYTSRDGADYGTWCSDDIHQYIPDEYKTVHAENFIKAHLINKKQYLKLTDENKNIKANDVNLEFPPIEAIKWIKIEKPKWLDMSSLGILIFDLEETLFDNSGRYKLYKKYYENSRDFTITWKLKKNNKGSNA